MLLKYAECSRSACENDVEFFKNGKPKKYCSLYCARRSDSRDGKKPRRYGERKPESPTVKCAREKCTNETRYRLSGKPLKYCSRRCNNLVRGQRYQARRYANDAEYRDKIRRMTLANNVRKYREDPEYRAYVKMKSHSRRADKLGVDFIGTHTELVAYLYDRDYGICQLCNCLVEPRGDFKPYDPEQPSVDHIVPLSLGGTHSLDNLQLAHLRCNLSKGNRFELATA